MTVDPARLEILRMEVDLVKTAIDAGSLMEFYSKEAFGTAMEDIREALESAKTENPVTRP